MHIIRCVHKHKIKESETEKWDGEEEEDGEAAGPEPGPLETCLRGRGPDGSTATEEATVRDTAGHTATGIPAPTPALGSPGCRDGGGPTRATSTTGPTARASPIKGYECSCLIVSWTA